MDKYLNKITCGDCLEHLKELPDNSIDCIITDPPYGDGVGYGRNNKEIVNNSDEGINYLVIPEFYRVLKPDTSCYIFTNWKFKDKIRRFIEENTEFNLRMELVIVKNNIGMGYGFRNQYELCLVLEKGKAKYNLNDFSNVQSMEHIQHDDDTHPHTKGFELIRKMIRHSTQENNIILDCFMGSGTTTICCKELDRQFIGFELDENYYNLCNKRLVKFNNKKITEWFN